MIKNVKKNQHIINVSKSYSLLFNSSNTFKVSCEITIHGHMIRWQCYTLQFWSVSEGSLVAFEVSILDTSKLSIPDTYFKKMRYIMMYWPFWGIYVNIMASFLLFTIKVSWHYKGAHGFPGGSDSKASACNAGDPGLIPGSGRSPGESHDRLQSMGSQRVGHEWGRKESDTTERLHSLTHSLTDKGGSQDPDSAWSSRNHYLLP